MTGPGPHAGARPGRWRRSRYRDSKPSPRLESDRDRARTDSDTSATPELNAYSGPTRRCSESVSDSADSDSGRAWQASLSYLYADSDSEADTAGGGEPGSLTVVASGVGPCPQASPAPEAGPGLTVADDAGSGT